MKEYYSSLNRACTSISLFCQLVKKLIFFKFQQIECKAMDDSIKSVLHFMHHVWLEILNLHAFLRHLSLSLSSLWRFHINEALKKVDNKTTFSQENWTYLNLLQIIIWFRELKMKDHVVYEITIKILFFISMVKKIGTASHSSRS